MQGEDDLPTLFPEPVAVSVSAWGETVEVGPLPFGRLGAFSRAVRPVAGALQGLLSDASADRVSGLIGLFDDHGDSLVEAVAVGIGRDAAQVGVLPLDDAIRLAGAVVEVNADFFIRRLLPAFNVALQGVTAVVRRDGESPSNN